MNIGAAALKAHRVIESCNTPRQMVVAKRYVEILEMQMSRQIRKPNLYHLSLSEEDQAILDGLNRAIRNTGL